MNEFSQVYGEALFDLTSEEQLDQAVLDQILSVDSLLKEEPDYLKLIASPSIAGEDRLKMLDEAFSGRVHEYLLNFLKILCERNAFDQFHSCAQVYENLYNEKHNIVPVYVYSAVALSDKQKEQLVDALTKKSGKTIKLIAKIDPEIRGGIRCEMAGRRLDNSIETKMDSLRRILSKKS